MDAILITASISNIATAIFFIILPKELMSLSVFATKLHIPTNPMIPNMITVRPANPCIASSRSIPAISLTATVIRRTATPIDAKLFFKPSILIPFLLISTAAELNLSIAIDNATSTAPMATITPTAFHLSRMIPSHINKCCYSRY